MNRNCVLKAIASKITNLLDSPDLLKEYHDCSHFIRQSCSLKVRHIVLYLLNATKQQMGTNIGHIRDIWEAGFPDVSKQAVSKARQNIYPSLFEKMFSFSVEEFYKSKCEKKLWDGRFPVFAVDGSRLQLPSSKSNARDFTEITDEENPSHKKCMALASIIYDVCNDIIAHAVLKPYLASEREAAKQHCESLEHLEILKGSVLVFDRGYYSEEMFRNFCSKGYFCVMRLKEGINLSKKCSGDTILKLPGKRDKSEDLDVRVISIDLGNGTTEYLATNMFDESLTQEKFKDLYFRRWPIEVKYHELKNRFQLEEFNGATSISVRQEFYITLLFSNLASLVKADADEVIRESAKPDNKYDYQANRSFIIGRLKRILVPCIVRKTFDLLQNLFCDSSRNKSQMQPGRSCPGKLKKKGFTHFNNMKTAV